MTEREVCSPSYWYKLFTKRIMKHKFISLSNEVLDYILSDGLVLPKGNFC